MEIKNSHKFESVVTKDHLPTEINIFGMSVQLLWQPLESKPSVLQECTAEHFYLNIRDVKFRD
jgi:hypothetical protein